MHVQGNYDLSHPLSKPQTLQFNTNDIFLLFNQPINIYYSSMELHMIDFGNIRNRNYCDAWYNSDFGARNDH